MDRPPVAKTQLATNTAVARTTGRAKPPTHDQDCQKICKAQVMRVKPNARCSSNTYYEPNERPTPILSQRKLETLDPAAGAASQPIPIPTRAVSSTGASHLLKEFKPNPTVHNPHPTPIPFNLQRGCNPLLRNPRHPPITAPTTPEPQADNTQPQTQARHQLNQAQLAKNFFVVFTVLTSHIFRYMCPSWYWSLKPFMYQSVVFRVMS